MKRCPHCRQLDHVDAIMCKHCMRNFADPVKPVARSTAKTGDAAKKASAGVKTKGSPLGALVAILLAAGVTAGVMFPELRDQLISHYAALVSRNAVPIPPSDEAPNPAPSPEPPPPSPPAPAPSSEPEVGRAQEAVAGTAAPAREEIAALPRAEVQRAAEEARRTARGRSAPQEPKTISPRAAPRPMDQLVATDSAAPPVPTVAAAPATQPLRVGGNIKAPAKIRDAKPEYPRVAVSARVQGVVIIEATIGSDGRVQNARVLRSIPLLDDAALDAVKQWQYVPTLLNGVPVPVVMTVTVQFRLD
jgi:periplasmic protein TonB